MKTSLKIRGLKNKSEDELINLLLKADKDKVTALDLSSNSINDLSWDLIFDIQIIKSLQTLDLSNNDLSFLPGDMNDLRSLRRVNLRGNPLISPPPKIARAGIKAICKYLKMPLRPRPLIKIFEQVAKDKCKVVDLSRRKITTIPKEIGLLADVEVLKLNDNKISSLPAEISRLRKLKRLELRMNSFNFFPAEIVHLPKLEFLDLEYSPLEKLPSDIKYLRNLKEFRLDYGHLKELPPEIGQLQKLRHLSLAWNRLKSIPNELCSLKNLAVLDLDFNNDLSLSDSQRAFCSKIRLQDESRIADDRLWPAQACI